MKTPLLLLALPLLALTADAQRRAPTRPVQPVNWPPALTADMQLQTQLACEETEGCPHVTYVQSFLGQGQVQIAIDTTRLPSLAAREVDLYVTEHKTPDEWCQDPTLVDVSGGVETVTPMGTIEENVFVVEPGGNLEAQSGTTDVGVGYDVVVDVNRDGMLDGGDFIDGWGEVPGFTMVPNLTVDGPYVGVTAMFNGGSFRRQKIYFPENVESLGLLPLVVISHGNGHDYQWYDHLGFFLSSWGYVVMSHENNTGPGIETASDSTLRNTNLFLGRLDEIAGGVLEGHVDRDTILWFGHSRGGEGVARAYQRLLNGDPIAQRYGPEDIKLVSSIAPTDFLGPNFSNPRDATFHLWTGGADADVNGCAISDIAQTFHLHERAEGERMSISVHGAGHADFHDGGGSSVADGPCLANRARTHRVMKGHVLPLIKYVLEDDQACKEFLWRQWEDIRPNGSPGSACIVVQLMYQAGPTGDRFVLDDFETNPETNVSSSGGRVFGNVLERYEGRLDDNNTNFNPAASDPFNGMTLAGAQDLTHGGVVRWDSETYLSFEIPAAHRDVTPYNFLSFRACQMTRQPETTSELGDLTFTVVVKDSLGRRGAINIGAYGGGVEEPYQRNGCGNGVGWANEWETIRIPIDDFRSSGNFVDPSDLVAVTFRFGGGAGSAVGYIGLDEIEFTVE